MVLDTSARLLKLFSLLQSRTDEVASPHGEFLRLLACALGYRLGLSHTR